jgi:hypothetical protein
MHAAAEGKRPGLAMIMPMAGRGSRFARDGQTTPKPLIDLRGRPFFWWASESLRRVADIDEMVFVVLAEHCRDHAIDRRIHGYYPDAKVVALPEVTGGAAETAALGAKALESQGRIAVNDCDHAFVTPDLAGPSDEDGGLICFRSDNPAYSYARLDASGAVAGSVEKQVVSPFAIAGCYLFASADYMLGLYDEYARDCPYNELFVSGLYNLIAARGGSIARHDAKRHISFGTPEEFDRLDPALLDAEFAWA